MSESLGLAGTGLQDLNRQFPHISDLHTQATKETTKLTVYSSIDTLLTSASQCNKQVATDVSFKQPHRAYIEWRKGEAILQLLGRHQEFPYLSPQRKERYSTCHKEHERQKPMYEELRKMVEKNNAQHEMQPTQNGTKDIVSLSSEGQNSRPLSMPKVPVPQNSSTYRPESQSSNHRPSSQSSFVSTHSHTTDTSTQDLDPLVARFSQLRSPTSSGTRRAPLPYPTNEDQFRYPQSPPASDPNGSLPHLTQVASAPDPRLSGPRQMPGASRPGPAIPPKKPLNPSVDTSFPRAPSPVYSPARNIGAPASIEPPRNSSRSSTTSYRSQPDTNGYHLPPQNYTARDARSAGISAPAVERAPLPRMSIIKAEKLHEYSRKGYSALVIDVRSREVFDEGHIGLPSVICIEPFDIEYGTSFDQLMDSLPFTGSSEIERLAKISSYDLVVLYDDNTSNDSFLKGSPQQSTAPLLRTLYDTLTTFNYQSNTKLKQPPVVLAEGIHGWIDLLGPHSLASSNTTGVPQSQRLPKPPQRPPNRRVSVAEQGTSREIRRRRLEDFTPMRPEEERQWREKLKKEQVAPADFRKYVDEDVEAEHGHQEDPVLLQTYDDFFKRFPPVEQQSMMIPTPGPPPRQAAPLPEAPARPSPAVSRPSYSGVTDSQASHAIRQSAQPPPHRPRFVAQSLKIPRTGLFNFGATCYMNATIQCLQATVSLTRMFLSDDFRVHVQENPSASKGVLPEVYAHLIRGIWSDQDAVIRPLTFKGLCGRLRSDWSTGDQQDAQEFLSWLLDILHEDLNTHFRKRPVRALTEEEEAVREKMPLSQVSKIEWDRWTYRSLSHLSALFSGQHASRVTCLQCGATSTTYETFWVINLPIPRSSGSVDIYQCLAEYCSIENLDDPWTCPRCRQRRPATKQIKITRLPQILIVNFKRFDYIRQAAKITNVIDFPIHNLNLEKSMWPTYQAPKNGEGPDYATTPPYTFDAYAVLRHIGPSAKSGHYTAVVKDPARNTWRLFDDTSVKDFNPGPTGSWNKLQTPDAYVVFYERTRPR